MSTPQSSTHLPVTIDPDSSNGLSLGSGFDSQKLKMDLADADANQTGTITGSDKGKLNNLEFDEDGNLLVENVIVKHGTSEEIDEIVLPIGSITATLDYPSLRIGDGVKPGGYTVSGIATRSGFVVNADRSPVENGEKLLAAYDAARTFSPHGFSKNENNRAIIILAPGRYDLNGQSLNLDTQFIDIVGLAEPEQTIITTSPPSLGKGTVHRTADDIRISNLTLDCSYYDGVSATPYDDNCCAAYFVSVDNIFYKGIFNKINLTGSNKAWGQRPSCNSGDKWIDCKDFKTVGSWGSMNGLSTGTYIRCDAGDNDGFGSLTLSLGTYIDCKGGSGSFGGSGEAGGVYIDCVAGSYSFGGFGTASGKFYRCQMTGGWSTNFSGYAENMVIKATSGNTHAISNLTNGGVLKDCTLIASGTGKSINASAARSIKIYGTLTTNAEVGANVTILMGTVIMDPTVS